MKIRLRKNISIYDVNYGGYDYKIQVTSGLGDEKMYDVERIDGTKMTKQEVDTLIEQFKFEQ